MKGENKFHPYRKAKAPVPWSYVHRTRRKQGGRERTGKETPGKEREREKIGNKERREKKRLREKKRFQKGEKNRSIEK